MAQNTARKIEQESSTILGRTFLFIETAYTHKALTWHSKVVQNLRDMIPELEKECVVNYLGEPGAWEFELSETDIRYTDTGDPIIK